MIWENLSNLNVIKMLFLKTFYVEVFMWMFLCVV